MLEVDITDKIFLSVKFVNNNCVWLKEHGCVKFDVATIKKFVKGKLSIDTFFFDSRSIGYSSSAPLVVAASPPPPTPAPAAPLVAQEPLVVAASPPTPAPAVPLVAQDDLDDIGELIHFGDDENFVGSFDIEALLGVPLIEKTLNIVV